MSYSCGKQVLPRRRKPGACCVCVPYKDPCEVARMQKARQSARGNNFCEQLCSEVAWCITKGVLLLSV